MTTSEGGLPCSHCGGLFPAMSMAGHWSGSLYRLLRHPADGPSCYTRVTVDGEPVGARRPDAEVVIQYRRCPEDDWHVLPLPNRTWEPTSAYYRSMPNLDWEHKRLAMHLLPPFRQVQAPLDSESVPIP